MFYWALIKTECPNYFTKEDKPNGMAIRLFDLFVLTYWVLSLTMQ